MSILFINACVREESRTLVLARNFLKNKTGEIVEIDLNTEAIEPLDRQTLAKREQLIRAEQWDDPMLRFAKQFAAADEIVIAAPFWDLSFPAKLKIYLEHVAVSGITFRYENGRPLGLCHAKRLTYITTSGGPIFEDFGYTYIRALARNFYGIRETRAIRATELDVKMISAKDLLTSGLISEIE